MKINVLGGIIMGAMAVNSVSADDSYFTYRLGHIDVHMLVEARGEGNPGILLNPNKAALDKYIPGGKYISQTNVFLIRSPGKIILVDTGFGRTIFDSMKTLGTSPDQVDAVLLTHMHGDHIGGLQKNGMPLFPKAKVYLAQQEKDFWVKPGANPSASEALAPYGNRVETFRPGELGSTLTELLPGIKAIAAFGHTPGHTAFLVESEGKKIILWGDVMHAGPIQFPLPDQSVTYDTDPAAAALTRRRILEYATANHIAIGGMHLAYPAIGTVSADGSGYRFSPAE
ncbi:methyl parathion hydrolase [Treponema primitia ZAS-2]|uniref:Methyl parathion hydrolase n=1 Tax=Treponema primitia (strain ATCC BAA-887 / DSM 12427 / ZAS-2) TaxID=545694 RepID=F5YQI5_TREPZ|nr:MBL fold metallo-hydrolase [Treponema primitia]AEF84055.1 methyl parathion hydrolase [Treponema primitia ZAS-2]